RPRGRPGRRGPGRRGDAAAGGRAQFVDGLLREVHRSAAGPGRDIGVAGSGSAAREQQDATGSQGNQFLHRVAPAAAVARARVVLSLRQAEFVAHSRTGRWRCVVAKIAARIAPSPNSVWNPSWKPVLYAGTTDIDSGPTTAQTMVERPEMARTASS